MNERTIHPSHSFPSSCHHQHRTTRLWSCPPSPARFPMEVTVPVPHSNECHRRCWSLASLTIRQFSTWCNSFPALDSFTHRAASSSPFPCIHLKYDEDVVALEKSSSQAEENRDKPSLPSLWFEPVSTISFRMFDRVKSLYYYSGTSTPTSIPLGKCTSFPAATDNHQVKQLRRMTFQLFRLLSSGKLHLFTWWRLIQIFPEWGKKKSNQIKFTDIHWRYKICQKKPKILFVKIKLNNSWGSEIKEFSHQADKMNFDELTCRIFPQNDY